MTNPKIINNVRLIQKCIVADGKGRILALRRAVDDHSRGGNWDLPGGGYEQGKDVIEAIKREVMEEVGLVAEVLSPIFFTNKIGVAEGFFAGDNVFGICYTCNAWSGDVAISEEHVEYKWINPKEFLNLDFGADSGFFKASMTAYLQ